MGGSLSSAGRDMGRKGHQWCWKRIMTCRHLGNPPRVNPTAQPIQSGHLMWQRWQPNPAWGRALSPLSPQDHPPSGRTLGSLLHTVAQGLSPGLLAGLCGMGGRPPPGQLALLENRRGVTVAVTELLPCSLCIERLEAAYARLSAWISPLGCATTLCLLSSTY